MLSKVKVFVPVSVEDELPEAERSYHTLFHTYVGSNFFYEDEKRFSSATTHWLREQEMYCFSKEELEKLVTDVYDECWSNTAEGWNGEIQPHGFMNGKEKEVYEHNKKQYINQLIK